MVLTFSIKSENNSPASTGPDSSEEALIWSEENLLESVSQRLSLFIMHMVFQEMNLHETIAKFFKIQMVGNHNRNSSILWNQHVRSSMSQSYLENIMPSFSFTRKIVKRHEKENK